MEFTDLRITPKHNQSRGHWALFCHQKDPVSLFLLVKDTLGVLAESEDAELALGGVPQFL